MKPAIDTDAAAVYLGDCLDLLRADTNGYPFDLGYGDRLFPDESIDAVVTDPPYGISFMGQQWDQPGQFGSQKRIGRPGIHKRRSGGDGYATGDTGAMEAGRYDLSPSAMQNFQRWCEAWAAECFRVLKPGGHLLAFGGARTWHRLSSGVEDAGFEIRDSIAWLYSQGFPKSMNVSNAIARIDEAAAGEWDGWGTALKPSFEPIVVGRKPLIGTVAENVLAHSTGALNIDATRIATTDSLGGGAESGAGLATKSDGWSRPWMSDDDAVTDHAARVSANVAKAEQLGRWPTNVVLAHAALLDPETGEIVGDACADGCVDGCAVAELDRQAPNTGGSGKASGPSLTAATAATAAYGARGGFAGEPAFYGDRGGASRFFPTFRYEAKAATSERPSVEGVQHPTVKPVGLMRWLARLVTPGGGCRSGAFRGLRNDRRSRGARRLSLHRH